MSESSNEPKVTRKWPSGATFVLYCTGISFLVLAVYVVVTKMEFRIKTGETELVGVRTGLMPKGVDSSTVRQKSAEFQQRLDVVKAQVIPASAELSAATPGAEAPAATAFSGTWSGNGSTYSIEQSGNNIVLAEITDGSVTAYGSGSVHENSASMNVETLLGEIQITLTLDGKDRINVGGQTPFVLQRVAPTAG